MGLETERRTGLRAGAPLLIVHDLQTWLSSQTASQISAATVSSPYTLGRPLASSLVGSIPRPPSFHALLQSRELGHAACGGQGEWRGWWGGGEVVRGRGRPACRWLLLEQCLQAVPLPPSLPLSLWRWRRGWSGTLGPGGPLSSPCVCGVYVCLRVCVCTPSTRPEANGGSTCPALCRGTGALFPCPLPVEGTQHVGSRLPHWRDDAPTLQVLAKALSWREKLMGCSVINGLSGQQGAEPG